MATGLSAMSQSKWVSRLLVVFLLGLPLASVAQNRGARNCSPVAGSSTATNIVITLSCSFGKDSFDVGLIRATLACNSLMEASGRAPGQGSRQHVNSGRDLFSHLQGYDGQFVFVDMFIGASNGCGLYEVKDGNPKWGVDYTPDFNGFAGDWRSYKYGYKIQFDNFVPELGKNIGSTILFPTAGNEFLRAHYGKAFVLEGLAKIKISDAQGFQFIELAPETPNGSLANHYKDFKTYLEDARRSR